MDFPFEGIPTVPPRKDMDHMVRHVRDVAYHKPGNLEYMDHFLTAHSSQRRCSSAAAAATG